MPSIVEHQINVSVIRGMPRALIPRKTESRTALRASLLILDDVIGFMKRYTIASGGSDSSGVPVDNTFTPPEGRAFKVQMQVGGTQAIILQ